MITHLLFWVYLSSLILTSISVFLKKEKLTAWGFILCLLWFVIWMHYDYGHYGQLIMVTLSVVVLACLWSSLSFKISRDGKLIKCAKTGDTAGMNTALKNGANVDAKPPFGGNSAVEIAISKGDMNMVETFLDRDAKTNEALITATRHGMVDLVALLLNRGVDPNTKSSVYGTPVLYQAALRRDVAIVQLLLNKGADPNLPFTLNKWQHEHDNVPYKIHNYAVCPSVVNQLVKELLESQEQRPCDICGKTAHGISRDFVRYEYSGAMNYSMGAKVSSASSYLVGEENIFLCHDCSELPFKQTVSRHCSRTDYIAWDLMEKRYPPSRKGDKFNWTGFGVEPKERWLRGIERSRFERL